MTDGMNVMRLRFWLLKLSVALFVLHLCVPSNARAYAADPACDGRVEDSVKVTIDCRPGYATDHDVIAVYLRHPAPANSSWRDALNYDDAVWVYNIGTDDRAGLIIDFHRSGAQVVADLYDDQSGDGAIAYTMNGAQVKMNEQATQRPTVRVVADGGWWRPGGLINFNLDITVDGQIKAMIEGLYLHLLHTDGNVDYTIHVRDVQGNGRPDYEWRQAYPPLADEDGFYHSSVMVNTKDDEPAMSAGLFWPFLGTGNTEVIRNYGSFPPPININWSTRRIDFISEFVASRGSPHNYFVYTIHRIKEGQLNVVNFESPFAFYNLGGPNPDFPDLSIRVAYWPKGHVRPDATVEQVDLTWRHGDSTGLVAPNWDYRLGLLGRNEHRGQVNFREFALAITPYDQLPNWVTQHSWDYGTFVAREGGQYLTTEHIYEWSTYEGVITGDSLVPGSIETLPEYIRGAYSGDIGQFYRQIRAGLRGEFSPVIGGKPYVYMSPIDHKLHLLKARQGIWNVDGSSQIHYANLDGDNYLDQWTYTRVITGAHALTTTRQLNLAGSHLIYSGDGEVILRRAQVKPSLFETLPPTTREQWQDLGGRLDANKPTFAPDDLKAMIEQFDGPAISLSGAKLRDYRPIGRDGFRFVLVLQPGFHARQSELFDVRGLAPGAYAVTYDGRFSVVPLTPPALNVSLANVTLTQFEPGGLPVSLRNDGLQDLPDATLELWAAPPQGQATLAVTQTVSLLAQAPMTSTLQWAAPTAGPWTLTPRIRGTDGHLFTFAPTHVTVLPPKGADPENLVVMSASLQYLPLVVLGMAFFAGVAALIFWQQWNRPPEE